MKKIILLCIICLFTCAAYAQTTIGSDNEPVKGALLDLKQNTSALENSAKGMVLPRVKLVNLKPDKATGVNSLPLSIGSPASESWDLDTHIGLTVYNIYQCPAGRTVYNETGPQVWDGSRWELLTKPTLAEATPAETSGANIWGKGVVHHAAKPNPGYVAGTDPAYLKNIYEEFYSADFGPAGRWMTTNLAAWKYDGIKHSQSDGDTANGEDGRTLTGPYVNNSVIYNVAYWCYPGNINGTVDLGGTSDMAYNNNPLIGLLYTWDAATAGKGGTNGQGNIRANAGTTNPFMETAFEEGTGTNRQQRIQGICPQGWHLPSDYEWFLLEKEIIRNTTKYSSSSTDINSNESNDRNGPLDKLPIPDAGTPPIPVEARVSGLGTAMKDICGISESMPGGTSAVQSANGFSILLPGLVWSLALTNYKTEGSFFTSSSGSASEALGRTFFPWAATSYRYSQTRNVQLSIRCKKD